MPPIDAVPITNWAAGVTAMFAAGFVGVVALETLHGLSRDRSGEIGLPSYARITCIAVAAGALIALVSPVDTASLFVAFAVLVASFAASVLPARYVARRYCVPQTTLDIDVDP